MKFVNLAGAVQVGRRFISKKSDTDVSDPEKLQEIIKKLSDRVAELEAVTQPQATEFEFDAGTLGAKVRLNHNFNCPIRWYVVGWTSVAGAGWNMVEDPADTTSNVLVLRSNVAGRAVVRIEPSQFTRTRI